MIKYSLLFFIPAVLVGPQLLAQTKPAALFDQGIVTVSSGMLRGVSDPETGLRYFWGIPYGRPPVAELRWREPQPVQPWKGIRAADHFGPMAMQKNIFSDMRFRTDTMSEDCLYLNVWTPAKSPDASLPVLVYFYGGGFVAGDGSEWRYDGARLAQKGIVTVTVNYRLGIFGFFSHPALTRESPHHASGNYGLLDQQAAVRWVHDNIAAFGGDPDRITIGGESAGSISVFAQMASPLCRQLIAGAIGESGAMIAPTLPPVPLAEAEKKGLVFARKAGAGSLEALRGIAADKLLDLASQKGMPRFSAVVDGYFFPASPEKIFESGNQAHIPLLVGWNSAESPYSGLMQGRAPTPQNYREVMTGLYGARAAEAMQVFPGKTEAEVIRSATALASDRFIVYSTWKWAELHRRTGQQKVFRYLFARPRPEQTHQTGIRGDDKMPPPLKGAGHSWEIEYALGNLTTNKTYAWTPDDYKVSATMLDYFANFIKTGDPNAKALPEWSPNSAGNPVQVMHLDVNTVLKPEADRAQFEFLDKIYKTTSNPQAQD